MRTRVARRWPKSGPSHALHYDLGEVGDRRRRRPALRRDRRRQRGRAARRARRTTSSRSTCPRTPAAATATSTPRGRSRRGAARASSPRTTSRRSGRSSQDYTGPDGSAHTRRGLLCRVRVTEYGPGLIRPHERTQPGPEGGPPAADPRHAAQPLAHLLPAPRRRLERARRPRPGEPWAEVTDADGTPTASGASPTPRSTGRSRPSSPTPSC